jgi:hypothetical protein
MGLGLYENPWMIDGLQSYIYKNPAYLSKFTDQIFFVRTDQNSGGLIYSPMPELNLGIFSGVSLDNNVWNSNGAESFYHVGDYAVKANGYQPVAGNNPSGATVSLLDPDGNSSTSPTASDYREALNQQDASIIASYIWNKMAFGLGIGYGAAWSSDSYDQTDPVATSQKDKESYEFSSTQIDAIIAWLFAFNDKMCVDADVRYTQYLLGNKYDASLPGIKTNLTYESDGAMDIALAAGFNWDYSIMHKLHTRIGYAMLNHSAKGTGKSSGNVDPDDDFDVAEKYDRKGMEINIGISDEMRFTTDTTAFAGFNFTMRSFNYSYSGTDKNHATTDDEDFSGTASSMVVPLILGIETKMSENWTGRFSVTHNLWDPEYSSADHTSADVTPATESSATADKDSTGDSQLNIGLSYKLGNFRFDWLANIDIFVEGPYIISGKSTTLPGTASTPMSMAFAATYLFGGEEQPKAKKSILEE